MKLIPLTQKAKNRIREGLTDEVVVIRRADSVQCFGGASGLLIAPMNDPTESSRFSRWVRETNDTDFDFVLDDKDILKENV